MHAYFLQNLSSNYRNAEIFDYIYPQIAKMQGTSIFFSIYPQIAKMQDIFFSIYPHIVKMQHIFNSEKPEIIRNNERISVLSSRHSNY